METLPWGAQIRGSIEAPHSVYVVCQGYFVLRRSLLRVFLIMLSIPYLHTVVFPLPNRVGIKAIYT